MRRSADRSLSGGYGNPCARPPLPGDVQDAGRVGLLEPRGGIKLDCQRVIDRMACGTDHESIITSRSPADLEPFVAKIIEEVQERSHARRRAAAE